MNNIIKSFILTPFNLLYKISPELNFKILFKLKLGYKLNLNNPQTFSEKLQWIKLYDHNPLMPICCDKYAVRSFVEKQGCAEILNPLIWQGYNANDIPFNKLPHKYVIKVTHGSTFNIIQDGTKELNKNDIIKKCNRWLKSKFLPCYGEWFYGIEKPRIIVENFIESTDDEQLRDYIIYCFNGVPCLIRIDTDRFTDHKMDFFNTYWHRLEDIAYAKFSVSGRIFQKTQCLEQLLSYAAKLSSPFLMPELIFI